MGFFTGLLTLPLAPVRATVWIAEQILDQAEQEYYDPATIQRQLEDVAEARSAGEIDDDEAAALEEMLVARLLRS